MMPAIVYGISSDIKHPRTDEFNVSFETQLTSSCGSRPPASGARPNDFVNNVIERRAVEPGAD